VSGQVKLPMTTIIALVSANLFPLWGVLVLGWDVSTLLMLFWAENLVIGILNVLRLAVCPNPSKGDGSRAMTIPFFIIHYGIFTFGHGIALVAIGDVLFHSDISPATLLGTLFLPVIALAASHALSFVLNFIRSGEYRNTTRPELMMRPYSRVVAMHLTIIFGAFLTQLTGQHWAALATLVLIKIALDLRAHRAERVKFAEAPPRKHTHVRGPTRVSRQP